MRRRSSKALHYSPMARLCLISTILLAILGCANQKTEPSQPSLFRCWEGIKNGSVYAGQSESEFLERYGPIEAAQVGHLRLYSYVILRGYEGLMVIAKEGQLVRAFHWTDFSPPHVYFDTMTDADRALLKERTRLN